MVQFSSYDNPTNAQKLALIMFGLRMAEMEMDCNLTKLANFFQVLPVYFREVAKSRL